MLESAGCTDVKIDYKAKTATVTVPAAVTDEMIEEGRGFVTVKELLNFVIAGTVTYVSLMRGVLAEKHKFL